MRCNVEIDTYVSIERILCVFKRMDRHDQSWTFRNKAGYTATPVVCRWAGAVLEVTSSFGRVQ